MAHLQIHANSPSARSAALSVVVEKPGNRYYSRKDSYRLSLSDDLWHEVLPYLVHRIARGRRMERSNTARAVHRNGVGTYHCAACGNALFHSTDRVARDAGWPIFSSPLAGTSVRVVNAGTDGGMAEVECQRCGGFIGELFGEPTHPQLFCVNSRMLDLMPSAVVKLGTSPRSWFAFSPQTLMTP